MYIKILKNYILGYVRISVEGYFIERLMNLCIKKGVFIWNSKRKKATLMETNISIRDFKLLIKCVKETKCKVKIKQRKGIPFILNKYRKRKIFFILLFLVIIIVASLSNFIWNIEIIGNQNISKEELIENLKNEGLTLGTLKSKINTNEIINKMRLERDDLAWIGINIQGTNAIVKVVEADKKPEIVKEDEYCNIVANKSGIIVKVNAINGTPLVKEGDVVQKNTCLIGGYMEGKYTEINYVHANGNVIAKVWYEEKETIPLKQVVSTKTENLETKYSVRINNFLINFYKTLSKFKKYDTIEEIKKVKLFSDFYLPIEIIKKTNYELQDEEIIYTKQQAKEKAVSNCKKLLDEKIENKENILNAYTNYNEKNECVEVQVIYEVLEEIGTKEKIVF